MQYPLCFQPTSVGLWAILCLVFGATVVSCSYPCHDIGPSSINFLFKLYHRLASKSPNCNILYSPVSISSALATLLQGAQSNTQTQILEGLQFDLTEISEDEILRGYQCTQINLNLPSGLPNTKMGSALFVDPGALPSPDFIDETADVFGSEIIYADFLDPEEAKHQIDEFIKEQTLDRIKDAIPRLENFTWPVLVSTPFIEGPRFGHLSQREEELVSNPHLRASIVQDVVHSRPDYLLASHQRRITVRHENSILSSSHSQRVIIDSKLSPVRDPVASHLLRKKVSVARDSHHGARSMVVPGGRERAGLDRTTEPKVNARVHFKICPGPDVLGDGQRITTPQPYLLVNQDPGPR
ncbi:serpin A11-like isoform X1 [Tachyglossus aculeatus]|uniref:serpin A11-like isoform X1 n=1 Tax=Tachyglossus aculeatus TaxID=9261 RepID=UPI0018F51707|nr:serpin A11-like isoform X1 [Tachyglossus aculeatus]